MTTETWLDLGPLDEMPEGRPVLRKVGGHRFACVRSGGEAFAIDDRCPHQGYPLSQGTCKDGVLTCEWHNWKFELATGECTFGGEAVRRYPTRIEDGRVHLSTAIDVERETARLRIGLGKALARDEMGRALREALRLGEITEHPRSAALGGIAAGLELCAQDGARRAEYGFDHGLAVLADLTSWAERGWIRDDEAFVAAAHAVAEPSRHLGARQVPPPEAAGEAPLDPARVVEALVAERREEAEARVRAITREHGARQAVASLVPFLARHLYDYGHGAIFVAKAAEIAERFPAIAEDILGAVTVTLAWATAETALPPFTATRAALTRLDAIRGRGSSISIGSKRTEGRVKACAIMIRRGRSERPVKARTITILRERFESRAKARPIVIEARGPSTRPRCSPARRRARTRRSTGSSVGLIRIRCFVPSRTPRPSGSGASTWRGRGAPTPR